MTKAVSLARSVSDTGLLLDGDLAAIAALSGTTGLLKKTAANTWSLDTSSYLTSITSSNVTTALAYTPENSANKGAANGYASLDGSGKVPASQLPSYVDDVLEYANAAARPATGETGKLYLTLDNNKVYRWSGSTYVEIVASPSSTDSVVEGSTNLYFTNTRADTRADVRIGLSSINALADVDTVTTAPTNGQALVWNTSTSSWKPGTVSGTYNTYTYTGDGTTTAYLGTTGMTVNNILVMLNGVVQTPTTDYSIVGTNINFTSAPANSEAIQIRILGSGGGSSGGISQATAAMIWG